jgi:hypothetical protein
LPTQKSYWQKPISIKQEKFLKNNGAVLTAPFHY